MGKTAGRRRILGVGAALDSPKIWLILLYICAIIVKDWLLDLLFVCDAVTI